MTSKIVVNNIEADAGISTVTFNNEVTAPTFNGNIVGTAATFSGNVDIAGALTYEDVTNVDSVGIITARSGIHVTGGSVGIGTDNPAQKLHIFGSQILENTSATGNAWTYYKNADRTWLVGIRGSSNDALSFYDLTSGIDTERLRIASDGNLGVGNNNPLYKLSVLTSGTTDTVLHLATSGGVHQGDATNSIRFTGSTNTRWANAKYEAWQHIFYGNDTERLRIDSTGRALLGSQRTYGGGTYYDDLTINNSNTASGAAGGAGIDLVSGNDSWGGYIFSDSDSYARGYIKYDHGDDDMVFGTSGSNRVGITSAGNLSITDGNLVIGTSGHGIDFSVTGDGSGTVGTNGELLDEYEEGTYTPVMVQGVTSPTYSIQAGRYTRIGNKVYVDFYIRFASGAANGSAIQIGGLPFTLSGLTYGNAGAGQLTRGGGGTSFQNLNSGDGNITFYGATPSNYFSCYIGGTTWATVVSNVNNLFIIGSFHYHA